MIEVKYGGDLGDNLFQYCFGRILAGRFGYALKANPIWGFPNTRVWIDGLRFISPLTFWGGNTVKDESLTSEFVESSGLHVPPESRTVLKGDFQHYSYYADHTDPIRNDWLRLDSRPPQRHPGDFAIWLSKRNHLSVAEIRTLARVVSHRRLFVVSESPIQPILDKITDLNPEAVTGATMANFRLLTSFNKIAFSPTATHWWAAYLSDAAEIFFPPCSPEAWTTASMEVGGMDPPSLRVPEDRYIYNWGTPQPQ